MIRFPLRGGGEVAINPQLVECCKPLSRTDTAIWLASGQVHMVEVSFAEVCKILGGHRA